MPPPYQPLVWDMYPVDTVIITGRFGQDYGGYKHRGLDLGCTNPDDPPFIYAPRDGTVVPFTNDGSFGIGVCLDHEKTEWYSLFAHMSVAYVSIGQKVKAGTLLGRMGWTGKVEPPNKNGTHLHWQVCKSTTFPQDISQSADPLSFPFSTNVTPDFPDSTGGVTEARVREIVREELTARGLEPNFVSAVTRRLDAISKATDLGRIP